MLPRSTELRSDIGAQLSLPFDQRWRNRRSVFVPPRAVFDPKNHSVDVIAPYKQAKPFVQQHHYSGSYIGYFAVGLFAGRELVGVASFGNAGNKHVINSYMPFDGENCCELKRLILLDICGHNAESWFVSRALQLLQAEKTRMKAILTFADPMQYQTPQGTTLAGHWGCIYQSLNMTFCGRSSARTKWLSPLDGRPIDGRMLSKIWCEESGQGYSEQALIDAGAPKRHYGETPQDWLRRVKPLFPKIKHPGTLAYGLGLTHEARSLLEKTVVARPYPKSDVLVVARSMAA